MACSGNCTIQEYVARNKSYDNVALDPAVQPRCRPSPPYKDAQTKLFEKIDDEMKPVSDGCAANCKCVKIGNQDPTWTDWASATIEVAYAQGGCTWKLQGSYEYKTRQFQGLCGPDRTVASAAFLPELGLTITGQTAVTGDQLIAIKDILKRPTGGELFTPQVEFAKTPIGDVFGPGREEISAYLDAKNLVAYLSDADVNQVTSLLGAECDGSTLITRGEYGPQRYVIKPLDALDYVQPINEGDGIVLNDWICNVFSPGDCINIFNVRTDEFLFSFTAPASGVSICARQKGDKCAVVARRITVQAFSERDCKGDRVTRRLRFALCFPN